MNTVENFENKIYFYLTDYGYVDIEMRLESGTLWLNTRQMASLFDCVESNIQRHINKIFKKKELDRKNNVHLLHVYGVKKLVPFYSLDVIISVACRVKSNRGTQFRIWANKMLKQVLAKGYAVSDKLTELKYMELCNTVKFLGRTIERHRPLPVEEYEIIFQTVDDYYYALKMLDRYDYQQLTMEATTPVSKFHATYENAIETIHRLKNRFCESKWFGNEKDDSFKSSIGQIYQTFDGQELYSSVEEKAAILLYLVVKNHSFTDGNKRIAATLFIWFLLQNGILYSNNGNKRIADNTLVALTLMIVESRPEEKDEMVKVVVNLINRNNI